MSELYDIAIVGAGPGGIAAAVEAKALGLSKVIIFEKSDNHSATIRQFYKENKRVDKDWNGQKVEFEGSVVFVDGTKETTLDFFDDLIARHSIKAHFHEEIEQVKWDEAIGAFRLLGAKSHAVTARNVVIAIGRMGKPNKPDYTIPVGIRSRVHYNLDACTANEEILVVGGGNSAIEYALNLADANRVALCYRQLHFTRLNAINLLHITHAFDEGGIEPLMGLAIEGLEDAGGGRVRVIFAGGSTRSFDRVIYAIGGSTPVDFLRKCGIDIDTNQNPLLDEAYQTSVPGLFVTGDLALPNGGSIGIALGMSYKIVRQIAASIA